MPAALRLWGRAGSSASIERPSANPLEEEDRQQDENDDYENGD
jgi:hypothetical protein